MGVVVEKQILARGAGVVGVAAAAGAAGVAAAAGRPGVPEGRGVGRGYGDHVRNSVGFRNFTETPIKPMVIEQF